MELTRKKLLLIAAGVLPGLGLFIYFVAYAPVRAEMKVKREEARILESHVAAARQAMADLRLHESGNALIAESEVSQVLNDLTQQGKWLGVQFRSISPGESETVEGQDYRVIPLTLETASTFAALGDFLGYFEQMAKGLLTVKAFEIGQSRSNPSEVEARLTLSLFLSQNEK